MEGLLSSAAVGLQSLDRILFENLESHGPSGLTEAPSGLTEAPSGLTEAQSGLAEAPSALTDVPSSRADFPSVHVDAPVEMPSVSNRDLPLPSLNKVILFVCFTLVMF